MSFILDALRKSETARRRSEAPDLFTTMPGTPAPAPAPAQWPMFAIGGVGVLSLIAALWLFSQRAPSRTTAETAVDPVAATRAPVFETTEPASPATASTMPAPAPNTASVEPAIPPPIQPHVMPPMPAQAPPPAPDIANPRDLPAPPQIRTSPPMAPPVAATLPAGDRIVSLGDLDPGVRNQLPPLKLSMHLWNETPSQRFVILDGQRLKEGDVLGEIVVERITRDGAVLAWRGARLNIEVR
jgi:general secretion pathway protein B